MKRIMKRLISYIKLFFKKENVKTYIYLSGKNLSSLPALPKSLIGLYCSNNQLTSLPELPNGLRYLWCYNNPQLIIESVPTSLMVLQCNKSQLSPNFKKHDRLMIIYVLN